MTTPTGVIFFPPNRLSPSFIVNAEADQLGQEGIETFSVPLLVTSQGLPVTVFAADPAMITVNDRSGEGIYTLCVYFVYAQ